MHGMYLEDLGRVRMEMMAMEMRREALFQEALKGQKGPGWGARLAGFLRPEPVAAQCCCSAQAA